MEASNEPLRQAMTLLLELPQTRVEAAFEDQDGQLIVTLSST